MEWRIYDANDVHNFNLYLVTSGAEIKDQLAQSLRNKLDDAVLDILFVTLDRNPHCKLTPEDVHFIQKPNAAPDFVVKVIVS